MAMGRELDGVREEVEQDLAQALLVGGDHQRQGLGPGEAEVEGGALRLEPDHVDDLVEEVGEPDLVAVDLEPPRLHARDVEEPVDQARQVLGRAPDHPDAVLARGRDAGVALEQLRVAEHGVEGRAQFVADADDVAALGEVGGFRDLLGLLQLGVGDLMGLDLGLVEPGLARRLLQGDPAALLGEHEEPGDDAQDDDEDQEHAGEGRPQHRPVLGVLGAGARMHDAEDERDRRHQGRHQREVAPERRADPGGGAGRRHAGQDRLRLRLQAPVRLAEVAAAGVEGAAERADRPRIGGALGHVLGLERVLADPAGDLGRAVPVGLRGPGEVVAAARRPGDGGRARERHGQRQHRREGHGERPHPARMRHEPGQDRQRHRAGAHGIDGVEMRPLEFDAGRRQAQRLVDGEVRRQRAHPCRDHHGVERERADDGLVDAQFHQQQRDGDVEDEPDHAARMAVGEARKEVRPGDGARIGVGDVDLQLRDDDEQRHQRHRAGARGHHVAEGHRVHPRRLGGVLGGHAVRQRQHGQERAEQDLEHAGQDPAAPGAQHRRPPAPRAAGLQGGHESQEIDLLADLRQKRQQDAGGEAELREIEAAGALCPRIGEPLRHRRAARPGDAGERQEVEDDPDRLRPELEAADQRNPVDHEWDHRERADEVAEARRQPEAEFQRQRHDGGLDRQEQEGEARVDQRGHRRADVAEARTPGQEVDVDAVASGVEADRRRGGEDDRADHQEGGQRVGEADGEHQGSADRLQRQEGKRAERRLRHAESRPAPRLLGGEAQGIVLQRLVGHEAVVVAPDRQDTLVLGHRVRRGGVGADGITPRGEARGIPARPRALRTAGSGLAKSMPGKRSRRATRGAAPASCS